MKDLVKTVLICSVVLACLCGFGWMLWAHRRVIKAWLAGEPLPEAPESCPASALNKAS